MHYSLILLLPLASGFAPAPAFIARPPTSLSSDDVVFGGNDWKPEDGQMKATDTPDFFPEDYNPDDAPDFTEGMKGSQAKMSGGGTGTASTPGMEDFGKGGTVIGGMEESNVPEGFEFVPSSVLDDEFEFQVMSGSANGATFDVNIKVSWGGALLGHKGM